MAKAHHASMGLKELISTVLTNAQEALHLWLSASIVLLLSDCLRALQVPIPRQPSSSLHRCLLCHDISRLPDYEDNGGWKKKQFKSNPLSAFHIDITKARATDDKLYLFAVIERTSKSAMVKLADRQQF